MPVLELPLNAVSTPSDWTPVGTLDKLDAVKFITPNFDDKYIYGDPGQYQWFTISVPGGLPTDQRINAVILEFITKDRNGIGLFSGMIDSNGTIVDSTFANLTNGDWYLQTEVYPSNPNTGTFWNWTDLPLINKVGIRSWTDPVNFPGVEGGTNCTYIRVAVDYGKNYRPCPRCCCCCMCFAPTIILTEGYLSLLFAGDPLNYRSPRVCFRLWDTPFFDDAVCVFTRYEDGDVTVPPLLPINLGTGSNGSVWRIYEIQMTAGVLVGGGCLGIGFNFEVDIPDGSGGYVTTSFFANLAAPLLAQCDPYHVSCSEAVDAQMTINALPLNPCDDLDPYGPVNSVFRVHCDGRLIVTCDPNMNLENCLGSDYGYEEYYGC